MTVRVAITGVSGDAGLGAIRALNSASGTPKSIWQLGLDASEDCAARHFVDAYARLPLVEDPSYVDALIYQLRLHEIAVLLPCIDSEIIVLSRARTQLQTVTCVVLAPEDLVEAANDKLLTASFLRARGITTPATCTPEDPIDLVFPVIAKPRSGHGSLGLIILPDQRSLDAFLKERRSGYCLQRYLDGPEFTVGFLYDSNGKLCDAIAMERTLRGGCTVRGSVVRSQVIKQFMDDFGSRVRGVGAVNAQLRVDSEIGAAVFEINARLSGSTAMRTAVGFNDPIRLVRHFARNEPIAKDEVSDATVYRYLTELVVLAHG